MTAFPKPAVLKPETPKQSFGYLSVPGFKREVIVAPLPRKSTFSDFLFGNDDEIDNVPIAVPSSRSTLSSTRLTNGQKMALGLLGIGIIGVVAYMVLKRNKTN